MFSYALTHTHTNVCAHRNKYPCTHTHTHSNTHTHTHTQMYVHTETNIHAHTHTQTHTHTHRYIYIYIYIYTQIPPKYYIFTNLKLLCRWNSRKFFSRSRSVYWWVSLFKSYSNKWMLSHRKFTNKQRIIRRDCILIRYSHDVMENPTKSSGILKFIVFALDLMQWRQNYPRFQIPYL